MQSRSKLLLVAVALAAASTLALAQGGPGMHMGDGPMMHEGGPMMRGGPGGRMDPAKMQAMHDRRMAALKATLKLTPAQEPAWAAFADAAKPNPQVMKQHQAQRQALHDEMAKLTAPQRLDKMKEVQSQHAKDMAAAMDKRAEATKTFYAQLSPEQQKAFDAATLPKHPAAGRHAGHGKGPHGAASGAQ